MPNEKRPLHGCVITLTVRDDYGTDASASLVSIVRKLGGDTLKSCTSRTTHVVWAKAPPRTLTVRRKE